MRRRLNNAAAHNYDYRPPRINSPPAQFRNGQAHTLYVHGIDVAGGNNNDLLSGVPQSFTLNAAPAAGTIAANPNPLQVCDGTGLGVTTVAWAATNVAAVEVHVNAPNGPLFVATGAWK